MSVGNPIHSTGFGAMENKENGPIFSVMPSPRQRSKEFLCEENPVRKSTSAEKRSAFAKKFS